MQGLDVVTERPVLIIRAIQGLEERDVHTDGMALRTAKP